MKKRQLTIAFILIFSIIAILIAVGLFFKKSDVDRLTGLTDVFDVNKNDMIAFVRFDAGQPQIYVKTDQKEVLAMELTNEQIVSDVTFSADGTALFYSIIDRNHEQSTIYKMDARSFDQKEVLRDAALITELEADPNNDHRIFYLKAATFENYSPIASARPHNYDIYSYTLDDEAETRHTFLESYMMNSLQVSSTEQVVYIEMADDRHAETADDIFTMKQRIFKVPLDNPDELTVISNLDWTADIYDIAIFPDEESFVFQSISNEAAGDTFQYELYHYDKKKNEVSRITDVQSYAGKPVITADGKTIYFIVNEGFATPKDDFSLYQMNVNGEGLTKMELEHP